MKDQGLRKFLKLTGGSTRREPALHPVATRTTASNAGQLRVIRGP